jgi:putative nucleotidyltransferase with HDIG domain
MADILFVDDERNILNALKRTVRDFDDHEFHFANCPMEALQCMAKHRIAVIVSDHKMPQMTGAEFLARVKEKRPDTVRIMLTGHADLTAVQRAINAGEIYRFLLKPWADEELLSCIRDAVAMHDLLRSERQQANSSASYSKELTVANAKLEEEISVRTQQLVDALYTARSLNDILEETLYSVSRALFHLVELARPELGTHSRRVADTAVVMGEQLGIGGKDLRTLEIAALLHDCGKLSIPAYISDRSPRDHTREETNLYRSHPVAGMELFKSIDYFDFISKLIGNHHERFDGSGFPSNKKGDRVPIEAYVIGLADEYDHLINRPSGDPEYVYQFSCQTIGEYANDKFPSRVVEACLTYASEAHETDVAKDYTSVSLSNLMPTMVLARDLYTMSGCLLLAAGSELTRKTIARIRSICKLDPVAGDVCILKDTVSSGNERAEAAV